MSQVLELFLGVLTAMGGFVEVGELTFAIDGGSKFGYALVWVVVLGTPGIMLFCEMAGRVAAVRKQPLFAVVREHVGYGAGLVTLTASNVVVLLTCAAEIGAIALLWQLMSGWPYRPLAALAVVFLVVSVWVLPFRWIERVFGLGGLLMIVFLVLAVAGKPDWSALAHAAIPSVPPEAEQQPMLYAYYVVALLSAILLPYETWFYASGGIEDGWTAKDLPMNRFIVVAGFALGSLLSVALIAIGAQAFSPVRAEPQLPGFAAVAAAASFGAVGLWCALGGMFFAFAGAAIETALSGAYNIAQFFGWPWGKRRKPRNAARFALAWIALFVLAGLVVQTGIDPVEIVEISIVLSVVLLPLTYFPLIVVSSDASIMGRHVNGRLLTALGWFYLVVVTLAALAAIPLYALTHGGKT